MSGEFEAITRISRILTGGLGAPVPPAGETWIGDDAAVLHPPEGLLLLAADAVVAGVHADLSLVDLDDLGWKALVVNVSDIAAMGGQPLHAVVTVAGPPDTDLDALYRGLAEASVTYGCPIVGGDLVNAPTLVVTVAVTGAVSGTPVLRSGARAEDTIWVTGPLGASAHGLAELRSGSGGGDAHRRPSARVAEGRTARRAGATAMIDISDGLAADLGHILDRSGVGCVLERVPVAPGATEDDALTGGEDYELLFCAPPSVDMVRAFGDAGLGLPVAVGWCTADSAARTVDGRPLPTAAGWQHTWHGPSQ